MLLVGVISALKKAGKISIPQQLDEYQFSLSCLKTVPRNYIVKSFEVSSFKFNNGK